MVFHGNCVEKSQNRSDFPRNFEVFIENFGDPVNDVSNGKCNHPQRGEKVLLRLRDVRERGTLWDSSLFIYIFVFILFPGARFVCLRFLSVGGLFEKVVGFCVSGSRKQTTLRKNRIHIKENSWLEYSFS